MAASALRVCSKPGCNALTRESRCEKHRQDISKNRKQADPFYSSAAWRKLKKRHREKHPLCVMCLSEGRVTPVDDVNHIKPRREYPELELDPKNLESLCKAHHTRVTNEGRHRK